MKGGKTVSYVQQEYTSSYAMQNDRNDDDDLWVHTHPGTKKKDCLQLDHVSDHQKQVHKLSAWESCCTVWGIN